MNKNYNIHLDKLHITVKTDELKLTQNNFKITLAKTTKDYNQSYFINYENILIGVMDYRYTLHSSNNSLMKFDNAFLYNINFQSILNIFLISLNIHVVEVKNIDIAIDTNYNLIKRFNKIIKSNLLQTYKNYTAYYYGNEFERLNGNQNHETKYITTDRKKKASIFQRIENKSNEIMVSNKNYILTYLKNNKIDTTKEIFRLELLITSNGLKKCKTNLFQNLDTQNIISKFQYKNLEKNEHLRYIPVCKTIIFEIDLRRLTETAYLNSIFNKYSKFNHERLVETHHDICTLQNGTTKIKHLNSVERKKISHLEFIYAKYVDKESEVMALRQELERKEKEFSLIQSIMDENNYENYENDINPFE